MSKLDQPLRLKHGLAAVVAALTLGVAGTAIPMATAGGGGGSNLEYRKASRTVSANSQASLFVDCPPGTRAIGGGADGTAGFANARGQMINGSYPFDDQDANGLADDGWIGVMDNFDNAGGERLRVFAICKD